MKSCAAVTNVTYLLDKLRFLYMFDRRENIPKSFLLSLWTDFHVSVIGGKLIYTSYSLIPDPDHETIERAAKR
jgi:hypothetical protein